MKITKILIATCCLIQASVGAVRLGSMSRHNLRKELTDRNLQGGNALPWTGPDYDIGITGLDQSHVINTSGSGDVLISMDISHLGTLEASGTSKDTLQVYFKVDSNPEQLWLDIAGEQYSSPAKKTVASGSQLTIRVVGKTTFNNEFYQIRGFTVTKVTAAPTAPVPAPTAPVPAPVMPPTTVGTCQFPWGGPDYQIGMSGLEKIETINTSCAAPGDVLISMDISHLGTLEASGTSKDTLQVYYKVDSNPEQLWLDIAGQQYSSPAKKTVAAGSQLTIRVVGKTSFTDEFYQIKGFTVTKG